MRLAAILLAASVLGAAAQPASPPTEHVTVTGTRSREVIQAFVQSFISPARMTGKIARWEDGICPTALGLKPIYLKFILQRVKDIAAKVGAPVNANARCKPNVQIVFTITPQALLDGIRKHHPMYLGYHDNSSQAESLAKIKRPIQAWYTTATKDVNGISRIDSPAMTGIGDEDDVNAILCCSAGNWTGIRIRDGYHSSLHHIIVVADPNKLKDYEIGALADYVAMLSLTQLDSLDTCQQLASIINLLAPDCPGPQTAITANDLGYLRGLYAMSADGNLRMQQDGIAYQMEHDLEGK